MPKNTIKYRLGMIRKNYDILTKCCRIFRFAILNVSEFKEVYIGRLKLVAELFFSVCNTSS